MRNDDIARGVTRLVWLLDGIVIKWPRLWCGIGRGMQANRNERNWWRWYLGRLPMCPVLFADPFGFVVVMPRAQTLDPDTLWAAVDEGYFDGLPLDRTIDNVGSLGGKLVMFDYGALSQPPVQPC